MSLDQLVIVQATPRPFAEVSELEDGSFDHDVVIEAIRAEVPFIIRAHESRIVRPAGILARLTAPTAHSLHVEKTIQVANLITAATGKSHKYIQEGTGTFPEHTPPHVDGLFERFWQLNRLKKTRGNEPNTRTRVVAYALTHEVNEEMKEVRAAAMDHSIFPRYNRSFSVASSVVALSIERAVEVAGNPIHIFETVARDHDSYCFPNGYPIILGDIDGTEGYFWVHEAFSVASSGRRTIANAAIHEAGKLV